MRAFERMLDQLLRSLRLRDASVELRDLAFGQITPASTSPAHGGHQPTGRFVVNASSFGSRTPFFTPPALLERGFGRRGRRTVAAGQAGRGTYYLGRRV